MNNSDYLIVHKSILPEQFELIIKAREMITNENISVSDACKRVNISRSTFYKYKDYIFRTTKNQGNRASIAITTEDKKGILSKILMTVSTKGANIISINQDTPLDDIALITLTIDLTDADAKINELATSLLAVDGVKKIDVVGVE